jgi:hypothetical protein
LISGKIDPRNETASRRKGLAKIVLNTDFIPQATIPTLYRAADVFVLAAHGEGIV